MKLIPHRCVLIALLSASVAPFAAAEPQTTAPVSPPAEAKPMPGPKAGEKCPDAQVAKTNGDPVMLSEMYGKAPIVLVFYRGGWCPYCTRQLRDLQARQNEIAAMGAFIVGVTPDGPSHIDKTVTDEQLNYAIVSDYQQQAAERFGLVFELPADIQEKYKGYGVDLSARNWDKTWRLPHPATYVIDQEGMIRYAYANEDYKSRANADDIVAALKVVAEERAEKLKQKRK